VDKFFFSMHVQVDDDIGVDEVVAKLIEENFNINEQVNHIIVFKAIALTMLMIPLETTGTSGTRDLGKALAVR
jgi:hypothetical protein